jgi:hypothetical protein
MDHNFQLSSAPVISAILAPRALSRLAPVSPRRGLYLDGDCADEPRPEIFMTDSNAWHNPSEDYPPSRPGIKMFLGAAVVCIAGAVIVNWAAISAFVHVSEIKTALGF